MEGREDMKLQLSRMHKEWGRYYPNKCGDCCNRARYEYRGKTYRKCERYGESHSDATDWADSWMACGKYNVPLGPGEAPLIRWAVRDKPKRTEVEGQTGLC